MKTDVAVLVNSCDAYSDLWDSFFEFFHIQWGDCPYEIYLNTETKTYQSKFFNINIINSSTNLSWTERLIHALTIIKTKYVLFILEDFYFLNKIENTQIFKLIKTIDKIPNFHMLDFVNSFGPLYYKEKIDLYLKHKYTIFKINATCNLWKRKSFIKNLSPGESPWQYEINGQKRSFKNHGKYYKNGKNPIIKVSLQYGVVHGKWTYATKKLFEEYNIAQDFNSRGFHQGHLHSGGEFTRNYEKDLQDKGAYKSYLRYTLLNWRIWMPKPILFIGVKIKQIFKKKKQI